jgi:tetratricopeptide (TPR) repeat protein
MSPPEQYLSADDEAESEDLELMRAGVSNAHLFHLVKSVYQRTLTEEDHRNLRKLYLHYQVLKKNPWFLGKSEEELFYNAFCRFFQIPGSLYFYAPNFSKETLYQEFPELFTIIQHLFIQTNAQSPGFALNEANVFKDEAAYYLNQGNINLAKEFYELALLKDKTDWNIQLFQAEIFMEEGKLQEAENHCLDILTQNPEISRAYELLSRIEVQKSDHPSRSSISQSLLYLESAIKVAPDPERALEISLQLFRAYLTSAQYVNALKIADEFFVPLYLVSGKLYPGPDPSMYAGWLRGIMGYGKNSYAELQTKAQDSPFNVELNLMYAQTLEAIQQYTQAARHLEGVQRRLSAFGILNSDYMITAAENYLHLGDSMTAYYAIQPILDGYASENMDTLKLIRVFSGIGMQQEAEQLFTEYVVEKNPYDYSIWLMTRAYMKYYKGSVEEAIEDFQLALDTNPYNLYARTELIRIHSRKKNTKQAQSYIQEALALDLPPGETYLEKVYSHLSLYEN